MKTRLKSSALAIFTIVLATVSCGAGKLRVAADIYPGTVPTGSDPEGFVQLGEKVLFNARSTDTTGQELWITDGTESGTELVRDIRIGRNSSDPEGMIELDGMVLFAADDGVREVGLWTTDGTPGGTRLLTEFYDDPEFLVRFKDRIFFSCETEAAGTELFVSDGTPEGTGLFVDLAPGPDSAYPETLTVAGDLLYFVADLPATGEELWATDGTVAGTRLVKDILPGDSDSEIEYMTPVGNLLFFVADDDISGEELWVTDGTGAGTRVVKDIRPGSRSSSPDELVNVDGTLLFSARAPESGSELWKSDGTDAGTVMVKDIWPGSSAGRPSKLTVIGNKAIFGARTDAHSEEPWVSDGTEDGTFLLKDIQEGSESSFPDDFTRVGEEVFFGAQVDSVHQLWKTDGTPAGTVWVKDVLIQSSGIDFMGSLLFPGDSGLFNTQELWISDGTTVGTRLVKNIAPDLGSSSPNFLTAVGDAVFFGALEGYEEDGFTRIYSLWKSRGSASTSERMARMTTERYPGDLFGIENLNDRAAIFSGRTVAESALGYELGISDGSAEGTGILKDIRPGLASSVPDVFIPFNDQIYFSVSFMLWRTDGTSEGTAELPQITIFNGSVALGDLYFSGRKQGQSGTQLWRTGTGLDTATEVAVINPGAFAQINFITEYKGALYFSATDQGVNNTERELWTSDGISGAREVKDIWPGPEGSDPRNFVVAGDLLFFAAEDETNGYELWTSDGTAEGTTLLKDIKPGSDTSRIQSSKLIEFNGAIYFVADDGTHGIELWTSDGTADGTRLVKDIYPGPPGSTIPFEWLPVELEDLFYFAAADPVHGVELWQSDGTSEGTRLAFDIFPGRDSSTPEHLTVADGKVYFSAFSPHFGKELHVYDPNFVAVPINLSIQGDQVVLEWIPGPDRSLQLEGSDLENGWVPISRQPIVSGQTESVSLPLAETPRFLRLVEP